MITLKDLFQPTALVQNVENGYVRQQNHPEFPELAIYNYTPAAVYENVWNEVTRQCRGLIVDWSVTGGKVVARPFQKFWSAEQLEGRPDLGVVPEGEPFHVFDKADGSLGIAYWRPDGCWALATRGSFTSDQAVLGTKLLQSNDDIVMTLEANHVHFIEFTPLFEIVGPSNRIVLEYEEDALLYLGSVHIQTGTYVPPAEYNLGGWKSVAEYDPDYYHTESSENKEGFVLWWPHNGFQLKVKHEEYKRLHAIVTMANTKTVWRALAEGQQSELMDLPDEFLPPVKKLVADFERKFNAIVVDAKCALAEAHAYPQRRDQANFLNNHCNSIIASVVFRMLDGKPYEQIIWKYLEPVRAEPIWGNEEEE